MDFFKPVQKGIHVNSLEHFTVSTI